MARQAAQSADAIAVQQAGYSPASTATAKSRPGSTARWSRRCIPNPAKRYDSLSEFLFDLRHPNAKYLGAAPTPLIERNPLLFWKSTTVVLALVVVFLLAVMHGMRH